MSNKIKDNGYYFFHDDFTNESVTPVVEWIVGENFAKKEDRKKHLTLVVNSHGGHVHSAFALIDTMMASKIPVHTIGLGMVASCGLYTFMAGKRRVLTQNTMILSHQYSAGSHGKEHELFAAIDRMKITSDIIMRHYKKCSNLSKKEIRKYLLPPEDCWITADEAIKYGLADDVVETY